MKLVRIFALALTLLTWQAGFALAFEIKEVESDKGIKAWLVSDSTVPLIAMRFSFRGGTIFDDPDKPGRSYFLSGMLDEGAGDLKAEAFQLRMSELAARMSYDAEREHFEGSFQTLSANRSEAFELLRLAVNEPRFDQKPMDKVRNQILLQIRNDEEDPRSISGRAMRETLMAGHPYGREVKGTAASVKAMTPDDLRAVWRQTFVRENLLVAVVGDITAEELKTVLDRVFGDLPSAGEKVVVPEFNPPNTGSITIVERNIPQSVMTFAMPGIARADPDFIPAYVMNFVLGDGGFGSRLMEEIREKRGLTYGIYTGLASWTNGGLLIGTVSTQNDRAGETLNVLRSELVRMAEQGPTQEELDQAKTYITGSYALRFDSSTKIAGQLLGIQQNDLGIDYIDRRNDLIRAVTVEDARRVAKRLVQPEALTVSIVGRPKGIPLKTGNPG